MLLKFSVAPGNILFQRSGALRFFTAPEQYALSALRINMLFHRFGSICSFIAPEQYALSSRFLNPAASFVSSVEAAGLKGGSLRFPEHIVPSL